MLQLIYPSHTWDFSKFELGNTHNKKATQRWLFLILSEILPNREIVEEMSLEKERGFKKQGRTMHFDIYVPSLSLAMEYQGQHHYHDHTFFGKQRLYNGMARIFFVDGNVARDNVKRTRCKELGISLVEVPYWWDGNRDSLCGIIHTQHPQLLQFSE